MREAGPYGEPRRCQAEAAWTEEDQMYPYLLQSMAVERAKDLRREASAGARIGRAHGRRAGIRSGIAALRVDGRLVRRAAHP